MPILWGRSADVREEPEGRRRRAASEAGGRERDRRFLLEGSQAVREALGAEALEALFTTDDLDPLAVIARGRGIETHHVANDVVRRLTSTVTPQAVVGVAGFLDVDLEVLCSAIEPGGDGTCLALLHEVRDPGNAGTVLRSADAVGRRRSRLLGDLGRRLQPEDRSRVGGLDLPPAGGPERPDVGTLERLRERGVRVLAMSADGATDLYRADLSGPVAFVFGNEAHGLPPEIAGRSPTRRFACHRRDAPSRSTSPRPRPCACSSGSVAVCDRARRSRASSPPPPTTSGRPSPR